MRTKRDERTVRERDSCGAQAGAALANFSFGCLDMLEETDAFLFFHAPFVCQRHARSADVSMADAAQPLSDRSDTRTASERETNWRGMARGYLVRTQ